MQNLQLRFITTQVSLEKHLWSGAKVYLNITRGSDLQKNMHISWGSTHSITTNSSPLLRQQQKAGAEFQFHCLLYSYP